MKVEAESHEIRDDMLVLMDKNLILLPSTGESKVLYFKVKGDCFRNLGRVCRQQYQEQARREEFPRANSGAHR